MLELEILHTSQKSKHNDILVLVILPMLIKVKGINSSIKQSFKFQVKVVNLKWLQEVPRDLSS